MINEKLTQKELEVMKVLWNSAKPLSAQEIPVIQPALKKNTVLAVTRELLKKSYIKISDIVYHNTVLARTYEPTITFEEYLVNSLKDSSINIPSLVTTLIRERASDDELAEIAQLTKKMQQDLD